MPFKLRQLFVALIITMFSLCLWSLFHLEVDLKKHF